MFVDTTRLMYSVFQSCRHASSWTPTALALLAETLDIVKQQKTFLVNVPDPWVTSRQLQEMVVAPDMASQPDYALSTANQPLFALIDRGTHELQALWASESKHAVRCLGYAFHMIPGLLPTPDRFSPQLYMFCFRIISFHWSELSLEMQQAFCDVLGLDLAEATTLVNSAGFSIQMWRTLPPK